MASVLSSILDALVSLLEGSSGTNHVIPSNSFKWHPIANSFFAAHANRNPRPFVIEVQEDIQFEGWPSDVSGNYIYQGKRVDIIVSYSDIPNDPLTLEKTIADDKLTIYKCITDPINFSATSGWCSVDINTLREAHANEETGAIDLQYLVIELSIIYREDIS